MLIGDAIDNAAMAAGSVRPSIHAQALHDNNASRKRAETRRLAWYAAWDHNKINLKWRRMYRHLAAYGSTALIVMPDFKEKRACIEIRDPLSVYPDDMSAEEIRNPTNVGFVFGRSLDWIKAMYPATAAHIPQKLPSTALDAMWDVVEWVDQDVIVTGILGPRNVDMSTIPTLNISASEFEVMRVPNRAGIVPAVCPARVTLDRISGQVANIVGTVDLMGLLMALDVVAAERGVFPDRYGIARPNETPMILTDDGMWKDGRTGQMNLTRGLAEIGELQSQPGPATQATLGYLERAARLSSGNPAINAGEMNSSIRSGNTVAALQGAAIDPRIQELQEVMEYTLESMNTAIAKVELGYFKTTKIVAFSGSSTDTVQRTYEPGDIFDESIMSVVRYPMPGSDPARMGVNIAQMVGAGLSSRRTARTMHPYIDNPDQEEAQIMTERLTDAMTTSILQQASAGALPAIDMAEIIDQYQKTGDIVNAIRKAQELAQERQAAEVPPADPAAQPGLALPGAGVEGTTAPNERIGPPANSQMNLRSLLASVGRNAT
jgi:hypothetical protein